MSTYGCSHAKDIINLENNKNDLTPAKAAEVKKYYKQQRYSLDKYEILKM